MINEGRPVYGLVGYVNEITTFGVLDYTVLCTQTHTHPHTQSKHILLVHRRMSTSLVSEICHPVYTEGTLALLYIIKPLWYIPGNNTEPCRRVYNVQCTYMS